MSSRHRRKSRTYECVCPWAICVVMATADRITVMNFGAVLAEGTPDEIRADVYDSRKKARTRAFFCDFSPGGTRYEAQAAQVDDEGVPLLPGDPAKHAEHGEN